MSTENIKAVFYSPRDTAKILNVSRRTIYLLIKSGRLPHVRINRMIRINLADIRALSQSVPAEGPTE